MNKNNRVPPVCRFCGAPLDHTFVDLGVSPLSNAYLAADKLHRMEPFFPLHAYVCGSCFLVQLEEFQSPAEIFTDYAYFSSYSASWLAHAQRYAAETIERFSMDSGWQVVELASNDGYLLRNFKDAGIPVLGIEPAENVAKVAQQAGIPTLAKFFGTQTARDLVETGSRADLLVGNNVLAHVPALNDFVEGVKILLSPRGVITMEFPHLMRLMQENQFDTIYHEHFSYLSLLTVEKVFAAHGLEIFDVTQLPTHGGSLRIYARHNGNDRLPVTATVGALLDQERDYGLSRLETYSVFSEQVKETKRKLLEFLIRAKRAGQRIVGYGAPAKGNTLLNYCGIRTDFLDYTVDISPHKQGMYLPGTRIPIFSPDKISETRPDYVLILPWNLKDEIMKQLAHARAWGGRFVVPIPEIKVYP